MCPQVLIDEPLAAYKVSVDGCVRVSRKVAGNTETSAPLSTRKERPVRRSSTDRVLVEVPTAAPTSGRRARFPEVALSCLPTSVLMLLEEDAARSAVVGLHAVLVVVPADMLPVLDGLECVCRSCSSPTAFATAAWSASTSSAASAVARATKCSDLDVCSWSRRCVLEGRHGTACRPGFEDAVSCLA